MQGRAASAVHRNPANGVVIVNYPPGVTPGKEPDGRGSIPLSEGPVWVDIPGADSSRALDVLSWLEFPEETATYCLLSHKRPQRILHGNTLFIFCQAVTTRRRSLFVPYPIRVCIRPHVVLTAHGVPGHSPQPLQRILPGVDRAIDGGVWHFTSILVREVTRSYVRVLDRLCEQRLPVPSLKGRRQAAQRTIERRLALFLSLLHGQRGLLDQLRNVVHRFLEGGNDLIDELVSVVDSVEVRSHGLADPNWQQPQEEKETGGSSKSLRVIDSRVGRERKQMVPAPVLPNERPCVKGGKDSA